MTLKPTSDAVAVTGAEEAEREARRRRRFHESLHPARHMTEDVLEEAADEAARSALSEEWPGGYDLPEREAFKAGFLAGARHQSQQRKTVKRMWIDQPSTLQPLHSLHGTNVLAQPETDKVMRVYFLSGDVISQRVPNEALSPGWRTASNPTLTETHSTPAPAAEREAVLEAINDWIYQSPPVGRQKVIIGCNFYDLADRILAALTTPAPAVKPHCSTCGKDVAEVLCETCGKWWADNPPPAQAVSTDEAIEQIVVGFSDKAILRLDIEEDDPRLSRVCDDMRQTVRAILSDFASTRPMTEDIAGLVEELGRIPVRTEIVNVDTGETGAQSVVLSLDLRDRILTALSAKPEAGESARYQPEREAVLEDCDIAWLWKVHTDAQSKGLHADQRKIERILAALTTPAPAVSRDEIVAVLERCRDREHNPFEPDNQTTLHGDLCAILSRIRGEDGDASDAALLADICDNMAEVLKPLPGIPDAPGQHAGTRATESGEGDEA